VARYTSKITKKIKLADLAVWAHTAQVDERAAWSCIIGWR
jgi:hypothetical protein